MTHFNRQHFTCRICPKVHYAKGYCKAHYANLRRNGFPIPVTGKHRWTNEICRGKGCQEKAKTKGLCYYHYQQEYNGIPYYLPKPCLRCGKIMLKTKHERTICQECSPVSRQRAYQLRHKAQGKCGLCNRKAIVASYCERHRRIARMRGKDNYRLHKARYIEYNRLYRITHKKKLRAYATEYRKKNKGSLRFKQRAYRKAHREEYREYQRHYRIANKDKIQAYQEKYRRAHKQGG